MPFLSMEVVTKIKAWRREKKILLIAEINPSLA